MYRILYTLFLIICLFVNNIYLCSQDNISDIKIYDNIDSALDDLLGLYQEYLKDNNASKHDMSGNILYFYDSSPKINKIVATIGNKTENHGDIIRVNKINLSEFKHSSSGDNNGQESTELENISHNLYMKIENFNKAKNARQKQEFNIHTEEVIAHLIFQKLCNSTQGDSSTSIPTKYVVFVTKNSMCKNCHNLLENIIKWLYNHKRCNIKFIILAISKSMDPNINPKDIKDYAIQIGRNHIFADISIIRNMLRNICQSCTEKITNTIEEQKQQIKVQPIVQDDLQFMLAYPNCIFIGNIKQAHTTISPIIIQHNCDEIEVSNKLSNELKEYINQFSIPSIKLQ